MQIETRFIPVRRVIEPANASLRSRICENGFRRSAETFEEHLAVRHRMVERALDRAQRESGKQVSNGNHTTTRRALRLFAAVSASLLLGVLVLSSRFAPGMRVTIRLLPIASSEKREMVSLPLLLTAILINAVCWFVTICALYVFATGFWREVAQRRLIKKNQRFRASGKRL
jgi:hypothetical protein